MSFFTYGFKTISPDTASIAANGKFTINLTYDTSIERTFIMRLSFLESNTYVEQKNSCWVDKQKTAATMTCFVNKKGLYKFKVFSGPSNLKAFPAIFEYDIYSSKTAIKPLGFPTPHSLFHKSDLQIIEPFYNPLTRGRMINFKIKTTTFDNIYIMNIDNTKNNKYYRELDNNGKGEFTGEDVYIFGQDVYIGTKMGNYQFIVRYSTIRDANKPTDATFPKSNSPPKNILYSPLFDTLQIGKTYNFKIKCESATKIAVLEGSNVTYLQKNGPVFSGNVRINGNANEVKIVNYEGTSYKIYYIYKTSK